MANLPRFKTDSVRVAYLRIRDLSPAELADLPAVEREREFASVERRRQFLFARWLLRSLLSRAAQGEPAGFRLVTESNGKPVCEGGPAISISHAGAYVVACVADEGEIGIDLEFVDPGRHAPKVARRFFSAAEADWLATQPGDRFFMLWVLKEAYVKALGCGIFGGLNGLQCIVEPPVIQVLRSAVDGLSLRLFSVEDAYLAVAGTKPLPMEFQVECWDDEKSVAGASIAALVASTER